MIHSLQKVVLWMQQLQFESSWDKQLAPQDRRNIEKIFQEIKSLNSTSVIFSPIREAINHKDALLVSVLVHNFTKNQLLFNQTRLQYRLKGKVVAEQAFTFPDLVIPPHVSMPWTFIFPKENYQTHTSYKDGLLELS